MDPDQAAARTTTVLICDDNVAMRALLRVVVELGPGMEVVGEAADGEAAIGEAIRLRPHVILLDLAMPVLSGFDALPRLREAVPAAKIVVFAGFAATILADDVLALGADSYLEKGADPATIVGTIERAVAVEPA